MFILIRGTSRGVSQTETINLLYIFYNLFIEINNIFIVLFGDTHVEVPLISIQIELLDKLKLHFEGVKI